MVGSRMPQVVEALARCSPEQSVIELVRLPDAAQLRHADNYWGIVW